MSIVHLQNMWGGGFNTKFSYQHPYPLNVHPMSIMHLQNISGDGGKENLMQSFHIKIFI